MTNKLLIALDSRISKVKQGVVTLRGGFADWNLFDLTAFTAKHNYYASRALGADGKASDGSAAVAFFAFEVEDRNRNCANICHKRNLAAENSTTNL